MYVSRSRFNKSTAATDFSIYCLASRQQKSMQHRKWKISCLWKINIRSACILWNATNTRLPLHTYVYICMYICLFTVAHCCITVPFLPLGVSGFYVCVYVYSPWPFGICRIAVVYKYIACFISSIKYVMAKGVSVQVGGRVNWKF